MKLSITTEVEISDERTANVLSNSMESGWINYWCKKVDRVPYIETGDYKLATDLKEPVEVTLWYDEGLEEVKSEARTANSCVYLLNREGIVRGWRLCAKMYPKIFGRLIDEDDGGDAGDADVFIQLCLFGQVIYG